MYVSFFDSLINQTEITMFILSQVLERITSYLHAQDKIRVLIGPAIENLVSGRVNGFVELLKTYLKERAVRSLKTMNESVLQGIVEIILDEPSYRIPELRLVVDGTKAKEESRYGFVNIFIPPKAWSIGVVLELKDITLLGLLRGLAEKWNLRPTYEQYEKLAKEVIEEKENNLLARKYMYWSEDQEKPVLTTVGDILRSAVEQCDRYVGTIALGKPKYFDNPGALDSRIIVNVGCDDLQGHVVMAIGGRRILVCSTDLISTQYKYQRSLRF